MNTVVIWYSIRPLSIVGSSGRAIWTHVLVKDMSLRLHHGNIFPYYRCNLVAGYCCGDISVMVIRNGC
ncbi:unnamed protein product [Cylindrotheca closterium]|uniref:Uncharacterized protein n=1 Tax=Cylindrotheca closterium TaxID=2856 RepID=A0AAD2FMU1_9STRA|nr:unnamed protein product [Cylindrotheca closterium]